MRGLGSTCSNAVRGYSPRGANCNHAAFYICVVMYLGHPDFVQRWGCACPGEILPDGHRALTYSELCASLPRSHSTPAFLNGHDDNGCRDARETVTASKPAEGIQRIRHSVARDTSGYTVFSILVGSSSDSSLSSDSVIWSSDGDKDPAATSRVSAPAPKWKPRAKASFEAHRPSAKAPSNGASAYRCFTLGSNSRPSSATCVKARCACARL